MTAEIVYGMIAGGIVAWSIPQIMKRLFGTRYRTERDCKDCDTRKALSEIKMLVVELAIRAGVPAKEVAAIASGLSCERSQ